MQLGKQMQMPPRQAVSPVMGMGMEASLLEREKSARLSKRRMLSMWKRNRRNNQTAMQPEAFDPLPGSFTVFIARHATPDRSQNDFSYHTLPGPALTEAGLLEARELGEFLRSAGAVSILSSPFERARQTAVLAGEMCGASVAFDAGLAERQPIESEAALIGRMRRVFAAGAQISAQQGPVALISHGSPVLALLRALGLPGGTIERCRIYDNRNLIPMAGVWRVERLDGELRMRLVFVPRGAAFPKFKEGLLEEESI